MGFRVQDVLLGLRITQQATLHIISVGLHGGMFKYFNASHYGRLKASKINSGHWGTRLADFLKNLSLKGGGGGGGYASPNRFPSS